MDVSDGLALDARRMAEASGVTIDLDVAAGDELAVLGLPGSAFLRVAAERGLRTDAEGFAEAKAITVGAPDLRPTLKRADLLSRDPREKERKKYGLRSARKREQFSKR